MAWPAVIAAGAAVVGVGSSIFGGLKASDDAKKAAKKSAFLTYSTRSEEIRRSLRDQRHTLGDNKARIGASNLQFSGSPMQYMDSVRAEFAKDISWQRKSRQQEYDTIKSGGQGASTGALITKGIADVAGIVARYNS